MTGRFLYVTLKLREIFPDVKLGLLDSGGGGGYTEGTPTTKRRKDGHDDGMVLLANPGQLFE